MFFGDFFICIFNSCSFIFINILSKTCGWLGLLKSTAVFIERSHCSQRAHILVSIFIFGASLQLILQFNSGCGWCCLGRTSAALLALLADRILIAESRFLLSTWSRKSLLWFGSSIRSVGCGCKAWVCVLLIESGDKRRFRTTLFCHDLLWSCWTSKTGWVAIPFSLKHF